MIIKIIFISIFFNFFLYASHVNQNVSTKDWQNSVAKVKLEKQLQYIVLASKRPIYHLRLDLLKGVIRPLIDLPEIKAAVISDNFSELPFLTAYKEKDKITINMNKKEEYLDKSHYFILESKIIYENTYIANVSLYIYKHQIDILNEKDLVKPMQLNKEEFLYLEEKKELRICTIPDNLPYEKLDEKDNHTGIFSDIIKLIEKNINTKIVVVPTTSWVESLSYIKKRKCDLLTGAIKTPSREKYLNFTDPYIKESLVIVTNNKKIFINNTTELYNKKVGIVKGYAFLELLKIKYPDIYFVEVNNAIEGLEKTSNNELFAFVDTLPGIGHNIKKRLFVNLKISGKLEEYIEISTASRLDEPILNSILQKAHDAISENTKESILKKWTDIKVEQTIDFQYLKEIIFMFITILLITLFWMRKLSNTNKKLEKATNELELEHQKTTEYAQELQKTVSELENSHKKLKILASTDSLTGLFNRGYFKKVANHILSLAKRNQTNLSIIILDIDNFKSVNDTYGHHVGDEVIISLAKNINDLHRKSDLSCRFGGEEFVILLPDTTIDNALIFAEKVRDKTEKLEVKFEESKLIKFTVSIGVSNVQVENEDNIEDSIKRADEALYKAKESGKNKVCVNK